ncbi:MAG TPA: ABC transporter substrate-binding protein, partial [Chromatiaceae bacterium]|nr:ABC transporter substrate-binding protein [Chromatiaceae bacterium]
MKFTQLISSIACAGLLAWAAPSSAADTIKIGSFLAVTGPASFLGDPELKTLQIYVDEINQQGGLLGKPVELIHYDTGGNA